MALYGLPAFRFLTTRDPAERAVLLALAAAAAKQYDVHQRNLAAHVVNTYARAQRRSR